MSRKELTDRQLIEIAKVLIGKMVIEDVLCFDVAMEVLNASNHTNRPRALDHVGKLMKHIQNCVLVYSYGRFEAKILDPFENKLTEIE